ncbi:MAG: DNA polymerase III subunit delta [Ruminococcus sp.]|nr:DNA polymerase III subunit delta [Ruminococcus sp.]
MPLVNETNLARDIRNNEIANVYYFYGKDIAMIEGYTKKLIKKLVPPEEQAMNYQSFEGKSFDLSAFADNCEVYPMFSDWVVVSVNDLNADSLSADDMKFLMNSLSNLPETTVVIFYATGVDLYKNKKSLTDKNEKLRKFCETNGVVCEFALKTVNDIAKTISTRVAKNSCVISKATAAYLAEKCNGDTVFANSETDKLCSYVDGGEITNEVVDLLCVKKLDADSFRFASAIAKGDSERAFQILDELYTLQTDSFAILSAVSMSFVDIYRACVGKSKGKNHNDVAADFEYKNRAFAMNNAYRDSSGILLKRIRKCMSVLSETDIAMKSLRTNKRLLLEEAVVKMLN